jgi:hypothetical protein
MSADQVVTLTSEEEAQFTAVRDQSAKSMQRYRDDKDCCYAAKTILFDA